MADYIPPGEVNLYEHMPELKREVYSQICRCCWAITVATVVGYSYRLNQHADEFEVSPQDIMDRVWFYSSPSQRALFKYDRWGAYYSNHSKAYNYVSTKGVSLLRDYPFLNRISTNIQPIANNEIPRIHCNPCEKLTLEQAVNKAESFVPVSASVQVTVDFINHKEGIYETAPGAVILGAHSVVIVGVNVQQGYFRIRNSWGAEWGENSAEWGENGYGLVRFNSIERFACTSAAWMKECLDE